MAQAPKQETYSGDHYVYSTLSNDQSYTVWDITTQGGPHVPKKSILVRGKANIADPHTFVTPRGVVTTVSADELRVLEADESFKRHRQAGYITVERKKEEPDRVARNMKARDESAPKTEADFPAGDELESLKPVVNRKG